jgi:hypothetical protein
MRKLGFGLYASALKGKKTIFVAQKSSQHALAAKVCIATHANWHSTCRARRKAKKSN